MLRGAHQWGGELLSERTFSFGGGGQGLRTFLTSLPAMQPHCFAAHLLDVGHWEVGEDGAHAFVHSLTRFILSPGPWKHDDKGNIVPAFWSLGTPLLCGS